MRIGRGSALAFVNIFSQLFAISGQHAYIDPPNCRWPLPCSGGDVLTRLCTDRIGHASALALSVVILVTSLVLRWYFGYLNAKKAAAQFSEQASQDRLKTMEELGDKHPGMTGEKPLHICFSANVSYRFLLHHMRQTQRFA